MSATFYLCITTLFIALLFIRAFKKCGIISPATFIMGIWLFSSVSSILYYLSGNAYEGNGDYSIASVLTWLLLFTLFVTPLYFLNFFKEDIPYYNNLIISVSTVGLALISFLPFLENLLNLFNGTTLYEMGSYHDELDHTVVTATSHLSPPARIMALLIGRFRYVIPVLFFNYINKNNPQKYPIIVIGLIFALFNPSIQSFSVGARNIVAQDLIFLIFMFLVFYRTFSEKTRKIFIVCFCGFTAVAILGSVIITMYRFGDNADESALESVFRYTGEGFINFYTDMWYNDTLTWGKNIFRSTLDYDYYQLSQITHIPMHVYYTFIGDLICDFGLALTIIICLFVFLVMRHVIIQYMKNRITPSGIITLVLYVTVMLSGFMYIPFMNTGLSVVYALIYIIVIKFVPIKYYYR